MPFIHVYAFERSPEKKRKLVQKMTEAMCEAYEVDPSIVTVYLFDVPRGNAAHAGILESEKPDSKPSRF